METVAPVTIRPIEASDNAALATIIRNALTEFGANKPGTVYYDPTTDNLFELFQKPGSAYMVAVADDKILGGAGVFPTEGLPTGVCELVKIYLRKEARGRGLGRQLIEQSLTMAREMGYKKVYLESMPELKQAIGLYEMLGFTPLDGPMGSSGHFGCDVWMIKTL